MKLYDSLFDNKTLATMCRHLHVPLSCKNILKSVAMKELAERCNIVATTLLCILFALYITMRTAGASSAVEGDVCYSYQSDVIRFSNCSSTLASFKNQYNLTYHIPQCASRLIDISKHLLNSSTDIETEAIISRMYVDGNLGCITDCSGLCFNDEDCSFGSGISNCLTMLGDGICHDGFKSVLSASWQMSERLNFNCKEWSYDNGDCIQSVTPPSPPSTAPVCAIANLTETFPSCSTRRGLCFEDCDGTCFNLNSIISNNNITVRDMIGDGTCDQGQRSMNFDCAVFDYDGGDCNGSSNSSTSGSENDVIHLLALHPLAGDWPGGRTTKPGVDLAVHLINTRALNWSIDPTLPNSTTIKVHWRDTHCHSAVGWEKYMDYINNESSHKIAGIIGGGCSNVCQSVGLHSSNRNIPQLSYGCTSPLLFESTNSSITGRQQYELFTSLMGSEMAQVHSWIEVCKRFNFRRVATISDADYELFTRPISKFLELARSEDIDVTALSFSSRTCHDSNSPNNTRPDCFIPALQQIDNSEIVVVFYAMYHSKMQDMFKTVYNNFPRLRSTTGRFWMGPGWYSTQPSDWDHEALLGGAGYSYAIQEIYDPRSEEKRGKAHDLYWEEFTQFYPTWNDASFSVMPSIDSCLNVNTTTNSTTTTVNSSQSSSFKSVDIYGFDAVFAFASAFARVIKAKGNIYNGSDVFHHLLTDNYIGVSGRLLFHGRQRLIDYKLVNIQPKESNSVCNQTNWEYVDVGNIVSYVDSRENTIKYSFLMDSTQRSRLRFRGSLRVLPEHRSNLLTENCTVVTEWESTFQSQWEPHNINATFFPLDYNRVCQENFYFSSQQSRCIECDDADNACINSIKIQVRKLVFRIYASSCFSL